MKVRKEKKIERKKEIVHTQGKKSFSPAFKKVEGQYGGALRGEEV